MKACVVKELSKSYGNLQALKNVSFEIYQGEIFGLIGPNGSGKTTTLRILATLLKPDKGEATIFDFSVTKNPTEIRKLISYLPEEAGAYKNLSGVEYLNFIADLYTSDVVKKQEFVERAIEISDLGKRLYDKVKTYSKGMVRKLLLARALMTNPKFAILDEPTAGLDVINSLEIRKIIKEDIRQGGTCLLSSHNMLEVEFLSDRVALLKDGEIIESGNVAELKTRYQAVNLEELFFSIAK
ncbi:MAG: ABC transporter ATP-binding protein [candidate division WOR-3 bacterium]|nr:ABC transporter ATP-binding protein [candidate division WOR-3 bacterium]